MHDVFLSYHLVWSSVLRYNLLWWWLHIFPLVGDEVLWFNIDGGWIFIPSCECDVENFICFRQGEKYE
ncbi:wsv400 [White spot syndrome virus]|uniref:Wsv400 n=1 Tax=White spot syndrome virus TaxID=342409 RepID=K7XBJ6_9VIRU|nr:wsv400 [White spot syndrome virus]